MCLNGRKVGGLRKWRWKSRPFLSSNTAEEVTQGTAGPVPNEPVRTMACGTLLSQFRYLPESSVMWWWLTWGIRHFKATFQNELFIMFIEASALFWAGVFIHSLPFRPTMKQGPLSTWLRDEAPSFSHAARAHLWHTCCFVPALGFYK